MLKAESVEDGEIEPLLDSLTKDPKSAQLSDRDRAMLDYAIKLTSNPGGIELSDAEKLRAAGFNDLAIHDVVCCVSYFAFVNRIADGLGIELEADS